MRRLSGKVAIVTGSTGGIGSATAVEFANEGADVVLQYQSKIQVAESLAEKVRGLGLKSMIAKVDFSDRTRVIEDVKRMCQRAIDELGSIDILVNLAGYPAKGEWNKRLLDLTPEDFFKPLNVDLFGSFLCAREVAPTMLKQKSGAIINVSSTPALAGHDRGFAFTIAKAGLIGLTKALAFELAPHIRVNSVALGNIETEWVRELKLEERDQARDENLVRRFGDPNEIAKTIAFLCSNDASFINGQTIVIDGGTILH